MFNEIVSGKKLLTFVKKTNFVIKQIVDENHLYVRTITVENGIEFQRIGLLVCWLNAKYIFANHMHHIKENQMRI